MLNYPVLKSCKTLGDRSFFVAARKLWNELPSDIRDLNSINKFKTAIKTYLLDKPFYSVKFDALYIYILYFLLVFIYLNLHLHLYFYIFVLRSYCNVQLNIYIDNCTIEINKIIILLLLSHREFFL